MMPAEWEEHEATWLAWPHNESDWPGKLSAVAWVYAEIVKKILPGEKVRIIVESAVHEENARQCLEKAGALSSDVEFFQFKTNRGWLRDSGPIFVRTDEGLCASDFRFNAWAKYPDWQLDNEIPKLIAGATGTPLHTYDFVLEGGAIDVNGAGRLILTEECMLDKNVQARNPKKSQRDIEEVLEHALGAKKITWLGKGIAGDDTHGHVDDVCRFVSDDTVVLCREDNSHDENYSALAENRERLVGSGLNVINLPMPTPLYFEDVRLPASYANFYICNAAVLVPTFNDVRDRWALGILAELFPSRDVVGIHAVDLVWGLGTLHCLTQQQPSVPSGTVANRLTH